MPTFDQATGGWNTASNWDGDAVPIAGQAVTIAENCVCTINCTTAVVGAITINGTLDVSTTTGSYILNVSGNISFGAAGLFKAGAAGAGNHLPANVNFEIHFTTTNGKFVSSGTNAGNILFYGAPLSDPTANRAAITTAAAHDGHTISVNGTTGAVWKAYIESLHANAASRAKIWVTSGAAKGREVAGGTISACEYFVSGIGTASGSPSQSEITITTSTDVAHDGFSDIKATTGYVILAARNIYIKGDHTANVKIFDSRKGNVVNNCEMRGYAYGIYDFFSGSSSTQQTSNDVSNSVFSNCSMTVGYYKNVLAINTVFIGVTYGIAYGSGADATNAVSAGMNACFLNEAEINATGTLHVGNSYGANGCSVINITNAVIVGCSMGLASQYGGAFGINASIINNTDGIQYTNGVLKSCTLSGHTNFDISPSGKMVLDSCILNSSGAVNFGIGGYAQALWAYVCSYNHNAVTGNIKAWSPGGNVYYDAYGTTYLQATEIYGRAFYMTLTAIAPLWAFYEQEYTLKPGQKLELYSRMQQSTIAPANAIAIVELQLKGSDSFMYATGSPLVTNTLAQNYNLQFINQEYFNSDTKPVTIVARWMLQGAVSDGMYFNFDSCIRG